MIDNIIDNINKSKLHLELKNKLISYAINLNKNCCPVIFDEKQLRLMFELDEISSISDYVKKQTDRYTIQKRDGNKREVFKPSYRLKKIQKWILKKILVNVDLPDCVHGFVKGKSILTNAEVHVHSKPFWVHCIDIKDFFPSIEKTKVKEVFADLGYSDDVATFLSEICTINGKLVQGFPTSPMLANIIFKDIDSIILNIIKRHGIRYSRYADDLTFSGMQKSNYKRQLEKISASICVALELNGFHINPLKTRTLKNKQAKKVTGLIVSEDGVRIPKKYIKLIRKELYYCKKYGVVDHLKYNNLITIANYKGYLTGMARFIYMVERDLGRQILKEINELNWE